MVADLHSGIFYEHAHRLTGMFVGFTSVTLCCVLFANDRRAWVRVLGVVILIMVISQGVLGGLRVTGVLTFSQDPSILSPSTAFAIVHGVFAHVIMATMAVAATATSNRWLDGGHKGDSAAPVDLKIATGLVNVLLLQLAIGAAYRHLAAESALGAREGQAMALLMVHVTVAIIVAIMAIATGIQGTVRGGVLRRMGFVLLTLVVLQLLLGVGAVVGVYVPEPAADTGAIPAWAVLLTSAHQANGALLLMAAAVMAAWAGRLALRSSSVQPDEPASASPPPA
jgi:cytochrome c oxidase assembly protein subunit 15